MDRILLQIADSFATAAVDPTRWMSALRLLADATGSARGQLIGIGSDATIPFNWANDFSEEGRREFEDMDGGNPRINSRIAAAIGVPLLQVVSETDYRRAIPTLESEIYLDFCQDYQIPHGCQTIVLEGGMGLVGLAVLRTERDGHTTAEQRALFAAAAPFVRSAVRTQMALEDDGPKLVAGALDTVATAAFVCGRDGRILSHTVAGHDLLLSGRMSAPGGFLRVQGKAAQEQLVRAIARHAAPRPVPFESLVLTGAPEAGPPLIVDITGMPRGPWSFDFEPRALVIVRGARQWHAASATILQSVYGLSPAEADVAIRLARGHARERIAEERGARLETIRSQIKAIFAKLDVAREGELVAMLGQLLRD